MLLSLSCLLDLIQFLDSLTSFSELFLTFHYEPVVGHSLTLLMVLSRRLILLILIGFNTALLMEKINISSSVYLLVNIQNLQVLTRFIELILGSVKPHFCLFVRFLHILSTSQKKSKPFVFTETKFFAKHFCQIRKMSPN